MAHFKSWGFGSGEYLEIESTGEYTATEHAFLTYQTQGESHIFYAGTHLKVQNEGNVEAVLQLVHEHEGHEEAEDTMLVAAAHSEVYEKGYFWVCAEYPVYPKCPLEGKWAEYGAPHNQVKLQESATAQGSGYNHANLYEPTVWIAQANGPEKPVFNTTEETLKATLTGRTCCTGKVAGLVLISVALKSKPKIQG